MEETIMSIGNYTSKIPDSNDLYIKEIDRLAEQYAEEMGWDSPNGNGLLPPAVKKEKLKLEFKDQIKVDELKEHLARAFEIIGNEGKILLNETEWELLEGELSHAAEIMENFAYDTVLSTNYAKFLGITAPSLQAIDDLASLKFEQKPEEALSLLALLTTLEEDNPESWFELGMCFQKLNRHEKALQAYASCLGIDPNHVGSKVFSAVCSLKLDQFREARKFYQEAKRLVLEQNLESEWKGVLDPIEMQLDPDQAP